MSGGDGRLAAVPVVGRAGAGDEEREARALKGLHGRLELEAAAVEFGHALDEREAQARALGTGRRRSRQAMRIGGADARASSATVRRTPAAVS